MPLEEARGKMPFANDAPPGSYCPTDLNGGIRGYSWAAAANNDILRNSGPHFSASLHPAPLNHDRVPTAKEICRQTMLQQESIFKHQVYELHRVYKRQKELMEEARKREHFGNSLKLSLESEPVPETSMGMHWLSRNLSGAGPSMLAFGEPPRFTTASGDEQRPSNVKHAITEVQQHVDEEKLESSSYHGKGSSFSSCRKMDVLFDLNEPPAELDDEPEFPASSSQHDLMNRNEDPSEKEKSNADCIGSSKKTSPDITVGESHTDSCIISSSSEKNAENGLLPCKSRAVKHGRHLKTYAKASCCLTPRKPQKERSISDLEMSDKNETVARIDVSPSVQAPEDKEKEHFKAPLSPENQESCPPRNDSPEARLDTSTGLSNDDRLAADTLVLIMSSRVERPIGCLDWFAGIASTLAKRSMWVKPEGRANDGGRRRAKSSNHGQGMKSSKGLKQQQQPGCKKHMWCFKEVWGRKKKRTPRYAIRRIVPLSP
ncbi:unnamed protein product [Cuscuta epithymum]|uniref:Uncharacterized protein n=2 Tax=Cuscuta epithymum TaxID=186058 RepID=A0AAV0EAD8_9ASTE|nr:unnamed protein product [Cuscuta epithymum]